MKNSVRKSLAALTLLLVMPSFLVADGDPFGEPLMEADGWKQSAWFGWYVDSFYPFVLHAQHQWMYAYPAGDWVWLWDYTFNEWFATAGSVYPMLYEPLGEQWLWYYEGTRPRWYVEMSTSELYTGYSGCLMPDLMKSTFEMSTDLAGESSDVGNLMGEGMSIAMLALSGDPATSVCPVITRTPEEVNLFEPPETILATVDFGSGCTPDNGSGELAGSLEVVISDLLFGETGIGLSLVMTVNNLMRDGLALLDGSLALGISMTASSEETETATHYVTRNTTVLNGNMTFTDLHSLDAFISGALGLTGEVVITESESKSDWNDVTESTTGDLTLTMDAFSTEELDVTNGTVTIDMNAPGTTTIDAQMETSDGPVDMTLVIHQSPDGNLVSISTVGTAIVFGYTLTVVDMVMDANQCEGYPVSGIFTISYSDIQYIITMADTCDGSFTITKG